MITSEWPSAGLVGHSSPFVVRQVDFVRRAGVDVEVFAFRGAKNPINYLKAWKRLRDKLRRERYDLVHAQFGQSGLLPWPKRYPLVVTFRGCELLGVKGDDGRTTLAGKFLQRLCRMVARRADAVILVSEHMRACLPSSVQPHIIPSGLDFDSIPRLTREEARDRLGLSRTDRLILFVGNPEEERKRYWLARQAVELLNGDLPARLIVGWDMPHENVFLLMNACDALVFTSRQEGSPNVVKEALACDLPIVSVAVGDVRERLQGVSGCEVCADDRAETIAAALQRVLIRGERIKGREATRQLDERVMTEKLIGVYKSVLKKVRPDSAPNDGRPAVYLLPALNGAFDYICDVMWVISGA